MKDKSSKPTSRTINSSHELCKLHINIRDLTWIVATAEHRSIRRTADTLNVRQSTLSRRIRDIESQLGVVLFERTSSGTYPTTAGKDFFDVSNHIIEEIYIAQSRLGCRENGKIGNLAIGIYTSISTGNMRATLVEYHNRFPEVKLRIVDGQRRHLLSEIMANGIDIAIITMIDDLWTDEKLSLWTERMIIALPENHPLGCNPIITNDKLKDENFLVNVRDPGSEFQKFLPSIFTKSTQEHITEHDIGLDRLLSLVGAGFGITLLLEGATGASYPGVIYREVHAHTGPIRINFFACWRRTNNNPALGSFLDLLRERYPDLTSGPAGGVI